MSFFWQDDQLTTGAWAACGYHLLLKPVLLVKLANSQISHH